VWCGYGVCGGSQAECAGASTFDAGTDASSGESLVTATFTDNLGQKVCQEFQGAASTLAAITQKAEQMGATVGTSCPNTVVGCCKLPLNSAIGAGNVVFEECFVSTGDPNPAMTCTTGGGSWSPKPTLNGGASPPCISYSGPHCSSDNDCCFPLGCTSGVCGASF
jgi:hypothetical protein